MIEKNTFFYFITFAYYTKQRENEKIKDNEDKLKQRIINA